MSNALRIERESLPQAAVIELHGDVSADGDAAIKEAYREASAEGGVVLFDLSDAQYINTSGISVLISVAMTAKQAGVTVVVAGASPHYRKVFDLVRFSSFVEMHDDRAAALASLG